jgi:hypothetical protein
MVIRFRPKRLFRTAAICVVAILGSASSVRAQAAKIPLNVGVIKIAALADVYAAQKWGIFPIRVWT